MSGISDSSAERFLSAVQFVREALRDADDPHDGMSPDGYCEAAERASVLRQLLAIMEPETWCPPHSYIGMSTTVRGEAKLTCELCGDAYIGTFGDEGVHDRPAAAQEVTAAHQTYFDLHPDAYPDA